MKAAYPQSTAACLTWCAACHELMASRFDRGRSTARVLRLASLVALVALFGCAAQAIEKGTCQQAHVDLFAKCIDAGCSAEIANSAKGLDSCEADGSVVSPSASGKCSLEGEGSCYVICDCSKCASGSGAAGSTSSGATLASSSDTGAAASTSSGSTSSSGSPCVEVPDCLPCHACVVPGCGSGLLEPDLTAKLCQCDHGGGANSSASRYAAYLDCMCGTDGASGSCGGKCASCPANKPYSLMCDYCLPTAQGIDCKTQLDACNVDAYEATNEATNEATSEATNASAPRWRLKFTRADCAVRRRSSPSPGRRRATQVEVTLPTVLLGRRGVDAVRREFARATRNIVARPARARWTIVGRTTGFECPPSVGQSGRGSQASSRSGRPMFPVKHLWT